MKHARAKTLSTDDLITPGPWSIHGNYIVAGSATTICQWAAYTDEADARLIAAAPDMLAALRDLTDVDAEELLDGESEVWLRALAVIRKAEGRTP